MLQLVDAIDRRDALGQLRLMADCRRPPYTWYLFSIEYLSRTASRRRTTLEVLQSQGIAQWLLLIWEGDTDAPPVPLKYMGEQVLKMPPEAPPASPKLCASARVQNKL